VHLTSETVWDFLAVRLARIRRPGCVVSTRGGSGRERKSREVAAWEWLIREKRVNGGVYWRRRRVFSATSYKRCVGGGFGSPEPEATVAMGYGSGFAGELEWWRGRRGENVWEVSTSGVSSMVSPAGV
jgi:hypothetical protein